MNVLKTNRIIRFFVLSDFFLTSAWGLIIPIMAIFVVDFIKTENPALVAGMSVGIYWVVKAILQIPISDMLDKRKGEKDDFYLLIAGMIITAFVPLGFIFASLPWHMYVLQAFYAIGMAFVVPAWAGIFTRHISHGHEAASWGIESSAISLGAGLAGIVGGALAGFIGFTPLFVAVSGLGLLSTFFMWYLRSDILPKGKVIIAQKQDVHLPR